MLLEAVSSAASAVKTCAEHLVESAVVDIHKASAVQLSLEREVLSVTTSNSEGISEIQKQLSELLKLREVFEREIDALKLERKMDAMTAKTNCLEFCQEYASQFPKDHLTQFSSC